MLGKLMLFERTEVESKCTRVASRNLFGQSEATKRTVSLITQAIASRF